MVGLRVVSWIANGVLNAVVALLLLVPAFFVAVLVAAMAATLFDLGGDQAGAIASLLLYVPSAVYLLVVVATGVGGVVELQRQRRLRVEVVAPDAETATLQPLVADVRRAGFAPVAHVRRGRAAGVVLVSSDGIVAHVVRATGPGVVGARPATDGSPAAITLLSAVPLGTQVAGLATTHVVAVGRRRPQGVGIGQLVPGGDPLQLVARHREGVAFLASRGVPVTPTAPAMAVAHIQGHVVQAWRGPLIGTVPWLRARWLHRDGVLGGRFDAKDLDRQITALIGLLPAPEYKAARARQKQARAIDSTWVVPGGRPPTAVLPAAPPVAPPTDWPT